MFDVDVWFDLVKQFCLYNLNYRIFFAANVADDYKVKTSDSEPTRWPKSTIFGQDQVLTSLAGKIIQPKCAAQTEKSIKTKKQKDPKF